MRKPNQEPTKPDQSPKQPSAAAIEASFEEAQEIQQLRRLMPLSEAKRLAEMPRKERLPLLRQFLRDNGIEQTARVIPPWLPDEEDKEGDDLIKRVGRSEKWTCPMHFKRYKGSKEHKYPPALVQCKKGNWSCSCPQWQKQRGVDCQHIKRVKRKEGIALHIATARRKGTTEYISADGTPPYGTRRNRAILEMPQRVPEMMREAITDLIGIEKRDGVGRKPASVALRTYGLFLKVFHNSTWPKMIERLATDETLWDFGWTTPRPPQYTSWVEEYSIDPEVTAAIWKILGFLPRSVRRIDTELLGDSSDYPTVQCDNSRDRKFGPKKPAYRKDTEQVRHHFFIGNVSHVPYAINITLDRGVGSQDGAHLVGMLRDALRHSEQIRRALSDKAYGSKRNFLAAEAAGIQLFVRERSNEDRVDGDWPVSAQELAKFEREHPDEYREIMAYRQMAENNPSANKRRTPHQRLRRRKSDPIPKYRSKKVERLAQLVAVKKEQLSKLPDDVIDDILRVATEEVGLARLNEALMIEVIAGLTALVMMEHICGGEQPERVNFAKDKALPPFMTVQMKDYMYDDTAA